MIRQYRLVETRYNFDRVLLSRKITWRGEGTSPECATGTYHVNALIGPKGVTRNDLQELREDGSWYYVHTNDVAANPNPLKEGEPFWIVGGNLEGTEVVLSSDGNWTADSCLAVKFKNREDAVQYAKFFARNQTWWTQSVDVETAVCDGVV